MRTFACSVAFLVGTLCTINKRGHTAGKRLPQVVFLSRGPRRCLALMFIRLARICQPPNFLVDRNLSIRVQYYPRTHHRCGAKGTSVRE